MEVKPNYTHRVMNDPYAQLIEPRFDEKGLSMGPFILLKTIQPFFEALYLGLKRFEVRFNDRNFQVGQWLALGEWDTKKECYTGRYVLARISYILDDPLYCKEGFVVLQLQDMQTLWAM